jgi:hypothetical protein
MRRRGDAEAADKRNASIRNDLALASCALNWRGKSQLCASEFG